MRLWTGASRPSPISTCWVGSWKNLRKEEALNWLQQTSRQQRSPTSNIKPSRLYSSNYRLCSAPISSIYYIWPMSRCALVKHQCALDTQNSGSICYLTRLLVGRLGDSRAKLEPNILPIDHPFRSAFGRPQQQRSSPWSALVAWKQEIPGAGFYCGHCLACLLLSSDLSVWRVFLQIWYW